jgi:hypothetical protein
LRKAPRRGERPKRGWIFNGTFSWFWLSWRGLASRQLPAPAALL